MRVTIEPIQPAFAESLTEHLKPFGLPPHIVQWKYFERPWPDRLSGLVWHRDGRVRGAIGLIPFDFVTPTGTIAASWTCDWVVDSPRANPGIGVMLLQKAKALAGPLFSLGGNELNRRLMSRLANNCIDDAAVDLYLPLRAGGSRVFRGINRRLGGALRPLAKVPMSSARQNGLAATVACGISDVLGGVLDANVSSLPAPRYTTDYLRWQLGICPDVVSATCYVPSGNVTAASICWTSREREDSWRLALWGKDDDDQTSLTLAAAIGYMRRRGAERVSIMASALDTQRLTLLHGLGFRREEKARPLFISGAVKETALRVRGLSYLDTDLAYRFH